jgi:hypothetical protein
LKWTPTFSVKVGAGTEKACELFPRMIRISQVKGRDEEEASL